MPHFHWPAVVPRDRSVYEIKTIKVSIARSHCSKYCPHQSKDARSSHPLHIRPESTTRNVKHGCKHTCLPDDRPKTDSLPPCKRSFFCQIHSLTVTTLRNAFQWLVQRKFVHHFSIWWIDGTFSFCMITLVQSLLSTEYQNRLNTLRSSRQFGLVTSRFSRWGFSQITKH